MTNGFMNCKYLFQVGCCGTMVLVLSDIHGNLGVGQDYVYDCWVFIYHIKYNTIIMKICEFVCNSQNSSSLRIAYRPIYLGTQTEARLQLTKPHLLHINKP